MVKHGLLWPDFYQALNERKKSNVIYVSTDTITLEVSVGSFSG